MRHLPAFVWCLLGLIWGSTWLAIKIGVADLPPFTFAGIRFLVAAIVLLAALRASGRKLPSREDAPVVIVTGLIVIALQYGLIFWAEVFISSGLTAILYTVMPLFGMVFAHLMVQGERMTPIKVVGVALGMTGVTLVFGGELRSVSRAAVLPAAGVLLAASANAFAIVLIKARGRGIDALGLTVSQMSLGCLPLLALGFYLEGSPLAHPWTLSAGLALLYLAVVGSALAFVLLYWLIKRMDVTKTQLIPLASTLVAIVLGALVLGERLIPSGLAGAFCILSGLALARLGFLRAASRATP